MPVDPPPRPPQAVPGARATNELVVEPLAERRAAGSGRVREVLASGLRPAVVPTSRVAPELMGPEPVRENEVPASQELAQEQAPAEAGSGSAPADQEAASAVGETNFSPQEATECVVEEACGACPPMRLRRWRCHWRCWVGPLFSRRCAPPPDALAELELQPPWASFHPVPTAPVFEPRYEYTPPQPVLAPTSEPRHLTHGLAPGAGSVKTPPPDVEMVPIPIPVPQRTTSPEQEP